jgi:hypothetical protein
LRETRSKHVPVGGGEPHAGEQNSFGIAQPFTGEQLTPVHCASIVS